MIVLGCGSIVTEVFVKPICSFLTVVSQSYENKLSTGHFRGFSKFGLENDNENSKENNRVQNIMLLKDTKFAIYSISKILNRLN